jgi:hypothetical protein
VKLSDWAIRRHRVLSKAPGLTRAAAIGLAVVGLLAVTVTVAGVLGVRPIATTPVSAGSAWLLPQPSRPTSAGPTLPKAPALTGKPTEVRIPTIAVDTTLETLNLDKTGVLEPPSFAHAGWYAGGTVPGDIGPAVIAGHIDSTKGPSVFYRLHELRAGDQVQVKRGVRWLTFTVVSTGRYPKTGFPTAQVYGPTFTPQLRLITCGGSFDSAKRSYVDNVVVYAVMDR